MRLSILFLLSLLCIQQTAYSQYVSVTDGDWNDCATWGLPASCSLPSSTDDIIISAGTTVTFTDADPSTPASDPFTLTGSLVIEGTLNFSAGDPSDGLILNNNAIVEVYGTFYMDTLACVGCIVINSPSDPGADEAQCADGTILTGGLADCHNGGSDVELNDDSVWHMYDGAEAYFSDDVRQNDNSFWLIESGVCYALDDDHIINGPNASVCGEGAVGFGDGSGGGAIGTSNFWIFDNGATVEQVCNTIVVVSGDAGANCPNPGEVQFTGEGEPSSIGDYVWLDLNMDGIQDANEAPIPGVTVNIYSSGGTLLASVVTDANGEWNSGFLPPGDYTVEIIPPAGYNATFDEDSGTASPDNTTIVSLPDGGTHETADFGLSGTGSIGDYIWEDTNGDGLQDPGEMGIAGVTVTLTDANGNVVATAITDAMGNYDFENLPPGDYTVTVTPPAGYANTGDPDGTFDSTTDVTLGLGEDIDVEDFGYQGTGSIGDTIWEDTNGDGIQDPSETGIAGVTVTLTDENGAVVGTAVTDAMGNYDFENLPPGDYTVTVTPPAGYVNTGDPDGTFDSTTEVTLGAGEDIDVEDFGYQGTGSIGDTIFEDTNGNGVEDPGEMGIAGVTVTLTDATGAVVGTAVTDAMGNYDFENLPPGDYTVTVTPPAGYDNTADPNGAFDDTAAVTLAPGEDNDDQDFGYQGNGSIGDFIWEDTNGDGVQDPGEMGIAGVTVTLTDATGAVIGTAVTNASGKYEFVDLPPGDYTVTVTPPAGYTNTGDPDGAFDSTSEVTLGPGENAVLEDFGYQGNSSISNLIWEDDNGDGVLDPGEGPIPGVILNLLDAMGMPVLDSNGMPITTTTDGNGEYMFDNLPPGNYSIEVDPCNITKGVLDAYTQTYDEDGGFDHAIDVVLGTDDDHNTADFGYFIVALDVELIDFTARLSRDEVELNWRTASETNNDYFEILHSENGLDFVAVGRVKGNGNTTQLSAYTYTHKNPSVGVNYYKLKQVDFDNTITYTEIRTIDLEQSEFKVFPNPFTSQIFTSVDGGSYAVFNTNGKLVQSGTIQNKSINMESLNSGLYIITITNKHVSKSMQIFKQ